MSFNIGILNPVLWLDAEVRIDVFRFCCGSWLTRPNKISIVHFYACCSVVKCLNHFSLVERHPDILITVGPIRTSPMRSFCCELGRSPEQPAVVGHVQHPHKRNTPRITCRIAPAHKHTFHDRLHDFAGIVWHWNGNTELFSNAFGLAQNNLENSAIYGIIFPVKHDGSNYF